MHEESELVTWQESNIILFAYPVPSFFFQNTTTDIIFASLELKISHSPPKY